MSKIRLEVEALAVESFATAAEGAGRGTVRAHGEDAAAAVSELPTCNRQLTRYDTCVVQCECTNRLRACIAPYTG